MLSGNPEARARLIAARAELVALREGLDPLALFVSGMTAEEASTKKKLDPEINCFLFALCKSAYLSEL